MSPLPAYPGNPELHQDYPPRPAYRPGLPGVLTLHNLENWAVHDSAILNECAGISSDEDEVMMEYKPLGQGSLEANMRGTSSGAREGQPSSSSMTATPHK